MAGMGPNVALVIPAYLPAADYGGPIAKLSVLAPALQAAGARVAVWTTDFGPGRGRVPSGVRDVEGVSVHYLRRWANYRWSPVAPGVVQLARRADIDIAHIFGYRDPLTLLAAAALRRRGVPYVVEMEGMTVPRYRNVALKRVFDRALGRAYIEGAAACIANSAADRADLSRYVDAERIDVIHNPVVVAGPALRPQRRSGVLRVAAVGRLAPVKNLDVLVQAVARTPGSELDIIGPTDVAAVEAQLRGLIADLDVHDRVRLRGPLFGDALEEALVEVDVVAMPSQTESFGSAALEAALRGIAVIVSDGCGVAPLVEEAGAGLVVHRGDVAALARAIDRLHRDRGLLDRLAAAGPQLSRVVAPAAIAARHVGNYTRILGGHR